jgi:two-component system, LytTR family, sensor kinase
MENKTLIKLHIIFWAVLTSILLFSTYISSIDIVSVPRYISASVRLLLNIFTFYSFYFFVTPKIFSKKGIINLISFEIVYLLVFGFIFAFLTYYPLAYIKSPDNPFDYTLANGIKDRIFSAISYTSMVAALGTLSKVSLIWYRNQIKQKEREKQNISNELAMLRAQINPHFLFNTLNNIKSLTKSLPSKAINSVDKLISIMQYMLYESSQYNVPLINEIGHINNYLDLEKIRYSDPDFIDFKISGDYSKILIPPLIFMPFIENAFKHGNRLCPVPGIKILIEVQESNIHFEIINYTKDNIDAQSKNSGFGLANIGRRLDLLFEDKYELNITNENNTYSVKLNLIIQ